MSRGYEARCAEAARAQGITRLVAGLRDAGLDAEVWQMGGMLMAAGVRFSGGYMVGTDEGVSVYVDAEDMDEPVAVWYTDGIDSVRFESGDVSGFVWTFKAFLEQISRGELVTVTA